MYYRHPSPCLPRDCGHNRLFRVSKWDFRRPLAATRYLGSPERWTPLPAKPEPLLQDRSSPVREERPWVALPNPCIGGASLFLLQNGSAQPETGPHFHVRGATKIYRRQCWQAIGGLVAAPGWDVVDEIKASMLGWTTESFADIIAFHHRPTGGAGPWRDMLKRGQGCYVAGYHPLYVAARCLRHLGSRPWLLGALGMGAGFLSGYLGGIPLQRDPALVSYVHQQQWQRLWGKDSFWR